MSFLLLLLLLVFFVVVAFVFLQFFVFGSSAIISVSIFYVWPKTVILLPVLPREARRLDTSAIGCTCGER